MIGFEPISVQIGGDARVKRFIAPLRCV